MNEKFTTKNYARDSKMLVFCRRACPEITTWDQYVQALSTGPGFLL